MDSRSSIRILGIDPGSRVVGFALLVVPRHQPWTGRLWHLDAAGVLRASRDLPHLERLGELSRALEGLLIELRPDVCSMEKAFLGVNASSTLKLGESRGVLLGTVQRAGVAIVQVTPAEVKLRVAGNGRADKRDVARSVARILGPRMVQRPTVGASSRSMPFDMTDAIAIAMTAALMAPRSLSVDQAAAGPPRLSAAAPKSPRRTTRPRVNIKALRI